MAPIVSQIVLSQVAYLLLYTTKWTDASEACAPNGTQPVCHDTRISVIDGRGDEKASARMRARSKSPGVRVSVCMEV